MCVTNTTHRRIQAVTLNPNQLQVSPSILSQRLLSSFPLSQLPAACGSSSSVISQSEVSSSFPCATIAQHEDTKTRPKRRRKPQKPGKTAKMNDRHFVVHNYHDHSYDPPEDDEDQHSSSHYYHDSSEDHHMDESRRRGGVSVAFPLKLHSVLDQVERDGYSDVISWSPHGRCFVIHKPKQFTEEVMPKYFRQSKLTSFQRQLNLYGFSRLTRGPDAGGYYHELFLRNREHLCKRMTRTKVKGTKFKAASSPDSEPDFYAMPPVTMVTPPHSSDEEMSYDSSKQYSHSAAPAASSPLSAPSVPSIMFPMFSNVNIPSPAPLSSHGYATGLATNSDQALDDAVDELFLNELGDQDDLMSDLASWDPNAFSEGGGTEIEDVQLGFMLEKLLEDF